MNLVDLYKISTSIADTVGENQTADVVFQLNESKHENLQQEVYRLHKKTLQGYVSQNNFDIIIGNVKFVIKRKNI